MGYHSYLGRDKTFKRKVHIFSPVNVEGKTHRIGDPKTTISGSKYKVFEKDLNKEEKELIKSK